MVVNADRLTGRWRARAATGALVLAALTWAALAADASAQRGQDRARATAPAAPATFEEKMAWILLLEDRRVLRSESPLVEPPPAPAVDARGRRVAPPPPPPLPDLRPLLNDAEARVRRRAALAVGRVGLPEGVKTLTPLLFKDAEAEVRQMAAFAMGLIGSPVAVEPLRAALADPSALVRGRAAEALAAVGDAESAEAIAKMTATYLADPRLAALQPDDQTYPQAPEIEAYRLGIYALTRLKAWDALAPLVMTDAGVPRAHWWPVAFALARMEDDRAIPALTILVRVAGPTRAFAARGLGARKAAAAVLPLVGLVEDWRADFRGAVSALRALGQIGDPAASAPLRRVLMARDVPPNLRLEAVTTLGLLRDTASLSLMLDSLVDPWPALRAAALRSVHATDPDNFLAVLSGLDRDPHVSVRMALASVLTNVPAEAAVPRLTRMLDDKDRLGVPAAIAALAQIGAPDLGPRLLTLLEDADVMVRAAAADAVGRLRVPGAEAALEAAYRKGAADAAYNARAAALGALRQYGATAALPLLREALVDADWAVRVRAAALIRELDPAATPATAMRPAPGRPVAEYTHPTLVTPAVSPQVYLETDRGTIQIELFVLDAPQACANFLRLAREGFFTGVAIHRVVPNFVVQDGDPRGDGEGGPGYTIRDEINQQPYVRGTVGMALEWADTGGSQWFITHSPQPHLDGRYTAFGRVVDGMNAVDTMQQGDVIRRVRTWDGVSMSTR